jgi:hypothetical protein
VANETNRPFRNPSFGKPKIRESEFHNPPLRRCSRASAVTAQPLVRLFYTRPCCALLVVNGVSRLVVSKLLNHAERGITAVYDRHSYDNEKRAALMKWERHLVAIVSGEKAASNIISLQA